MEKKIKELEKIIKYNFKKFSLLKKALTHKSFDNNYNNEKLEFLGDRVLGLVISEKLLEKYPDEKEGIIDKKFANLVNKKTCLLIAKKMHIKNYCIDFTRSKKLGEMVIEILKKNNIKLICLAGFMKILPEYFIKLFHGKIVNIHPSLLPKYKGLDTHKRVILNNEKYTGCTIHYVSKFLDSGKIISQKRVRITKKDTAKSIEKKVLKIEHKIYPKTIDKILSSP